MHRFSLLLWLSKVWALTVVSKSWGIILTCKSGFFTSNCGWLALTNITPAVQEGTQHFIDGIFTIILNAQYNIRHVFSFMIITIDNKFICCICFRINKGKLSIKSDKVVCLFVLHWVIGAVSNFHHRDIFTLLLPWACARTLTKHCMWASEPQWSRQGYKYW